MITFWIKTILITAALIFLFGNLNTVSAQQNIMEDSIYTFKMKDGQIFNGTVKIREKDYLYEVQSNKGMLLLLEEDIEEIVLTSEFLKPEITWPDSVHSARYLYTPGSYNLRKGDFYYQNYLIVGQQFVYGFSDRFSLGLGLFPTFSDDPEYILAYSITPKISFDYKNKKGAFSAMAGVLTAFPAQSALGLFYISNTFGTRDKNLTVGLATFYRQDEEIHKSLNISISGYLKVSKRWAVITDNMFLSNHHDEPKFSLEESYFVFSGGARYIKKRFSLTLGAFLLFKPNDYSEFYPIPWLTMGVLLNKREKRK
jgi:hypothetical protein